MHAKQKVRPSLLLDGARRRRRPRHGLREGGGIASWTSLYPNGFATNEGQGHLGVREEALADRASARPAQWTEGGDKPFVPHSEMLAHSNLWRPDQDQQNWIEGKYRLLGAGPIIRLESNPTTPKSLLRR